MEQSRDSSALSLRRSPGCWGESARSRVGAEAGSRQEASALVQARWWWGQGGSLQSGRRFQIWGHVKAKPTEHKDYSLPTY